MTSTVPLGCDLSHNNAAVQFHEMRRAGLSFVILKATEGHGFSDPAFQSLRERAESVGLLTGSYHYFRPTWDARTQAEHYLRTTGSLKGRIRPALDVELDSNERPGVDPAAYVRSMAAWLVAVETAAGVPPIIYSYRDFWRWLGNPREFGRYPLWVADYDRSPDPLEGWDTWTLWQYTDRGSAGGASGVDLDRCRDEQTLQSLVIP